MLVTRAQSEVARRVDGLFNVQGGRGERRHLPRRERKNLRTLVGYDAGENNWYTL